MQSCVNEGLFREVRMPNGDTTMKMMQWKGDAVLSLRMRTLAAEKVSEEVPTEMSRSAMAWVTLVAAFSVGNASLIRLCRLIGLPTMLGMRRLDGKPEADLVEAVIFQLHDRLTMFPGTRLRLLTAAMDATMEALFAIGRQRAVSTPDPPWRQSGDHRTWLQSYAVKEMTEPYTHSSLRGSRDWCTQTGRLFFPDTPEIYEQLSKVVVAMHDMNKPLCWVEMATERYPFYEDIDIMGANASEPPTDALDEHFWNLRAKILHEMYPNLPAIELTLFTAHGYQQEKECNKASFHAIWNNIVVDRTRAGAVRLATIARFEEESSSPNGRMAGVKQRLLRADERNEWLAVFDQASVKGGSFRMPFCDKVHHGRTEGRQVLPEAVWRFTFSDAGETRRTTAYRKEDLSGVEWAKRGRVRLLPNPDDMTLPPLTEWHRPLLSLGPKKLVKRNPGGSGRTWTERQRFKEQKVQEKWEEEQRLRRRRWRGTALDFKKRLDEFMDDPDGFATTWTEIKARKGARRWAWYSRHLKGAIEIEETSGEVFLRGSTENQVVLLDMVRQFTEDWDGRIPSLKGKAKGKLVGKGRMKGSAFKGKKGGGVGGKKGAGIRRR